MQEIKAFREFFEENRSKFTTAVDIEELYKLRKLLGDALVESLVYSNFDLEWMREEIKRVFLPSRNLCQEEVMN